MWYTVRSVTCTYIRTSPYYVPPYAECGITYGYFLSFVSKKVSTVMYIYVGAESPNSVFLPQYTKVYIHTYLSISLFLHVCMCTSLLLILHMIVLSCSRCVSGLRNNYVCMISHLCTYTFPSPLLPHWRYSRHLHQKLSSREPLTRESLLHLKPLTSQLPVTWRFTSQRSTSITIWSRRMLLRREASSWRKGMSLKYGCQAEGEGIHSHMHN